MEAYLAKLPKDMLIEIIKKGFDMEYLSQKELHRMYKESKEKLNKKIQESSFNKEKHQILSEEDDHKIIIEWGWNGKIIRVYLILGAKDLEKKLIFNISTLDCRMGMEKELLAFYAGRFLNFEKLIEMAKTKIAEFRDKYNLSHGEINWDVLREMYDNCLIWYDLSLN